MKHITRLLAVAILATAAHAAPFLAVGDNAEIFITGTVGVRADSNIYMSPSNTEDTIFDFNPGLQLVFGRNSTLQGALSYTQNFTKFADHSDLDDSLTSTSLTTRYDDGKSQLAFNASFSELNQNSVDTLGGDFLIARSVFNVGGTGEVSVTEKSSVSGGVQYQNSEFERAGFSDSQVITVPLNYYYEVTPKVDLSLGYRFRDRTETIGFDARDHFLSVGARGEFTPKLSGQFAVGLTQRNFSHKAMTRDDSSLLGIDSSLTYAASPKTNVQFGVSNDFDTNSQGQQQKNLAVRASVSTTLSAEWTVTTGLAYRAIDYFTRIDDYFEGQIGATYTVTQQVSVTGAFAYRSNSSELPTSDFKAKTVSLAANFRF